MPGDRHACVTMRDIDGELVAAGEKFLGAVERVDAARKLGSRLIGGRARDAFFGDDRNARQQAVNASMMMASEASSAAVTGDRSVLDASLDRCTRCQRRRRGARDDRRSARR